MSSLPHSLFTTDTLPEKDRFAAWREDMSVIFDVEKSPINDPSPYHASFKLHHFGQSVIGDLKASTGRYLRTRRKLSRDGLDAILVQLFLEGGVQFGVGRRTTYAQAGDIVIFDLSQRVDNINTEFRHITSMWPRESIEQVLPDVARWHGHALPKHNPVVSILRQHMISCSEMACHLNPEQGRRVEAATLALAGAAMSGSEFTDDGGVDPAMKEVLTYQIKRYIRKNLSTSTLSPDKIARHFGISRTRLYEMLEPVGGISNYQRHLRLQRCLADLQNPQHANLQISEIAYRWGFNNLATFNRNFRKAFDCTPGEARVTVHGGNRVSPVCSPHPRQNEQILKDHHQWFQAIGI